MLYSDTTRMLEVHIIKGAEHFFVGHLDELKQVIITVDTAPAKDLIHAE